MNTTEIKRIVAFIRSKPARERSQWFTDYHPLCDLDKADKALSVMDAYASEPRMIAQIIGMQFLQQLEDVYHNSADEHAQAEAARERRERDEFFKDFNRGAA